MLLTEALTGSLLKRQAFSDEDAEQLKHGNLKNVWKMMNLQRVQVEVGKS